MKSKQIIVMRKDLNMRKGKMVSQGAHASLKAILDKGSLSPNEGGSDDFFLDIPRDSALSDWIFGKFTKITVSVDSEEELLDLYKRAKDKGLLCSLITDAGLTEFNGVPTNTCIAIGPAWEDELNELTGGLKLL